MADRQRPPLRLVPSSGRRLKEVSQSVDLLLTLLGPFMAAAFVKHPEFKDWMLNDLKAMRRGSITPEQEAAFDNAIDIISQMRLIKH
jgi:hypothetical protein